MFVLYRPGKDVWAFGVEPAKVKYRLRLARYPALAESLTEWLSDKPEHTKLKLLDIGAGFGRTFLYLQAAGIAERFDLRGLDIDPGRKDDVYADNQWRIEQGDAEQDLPDADASLDVVVCEQLLEHLNHPEFVLRNVCRVLKPDGLFVVGVPIFPEPLAASACLSCRRATSARVRTHSDLFVALDSPRPAGRFRDHRGAWFPHDIRRSVAAPGKSSVVVPVQSLAGSQAAGAVYRSAAAGQTAPRNARRSAAPPTRMKNGPAQATAMSPARIMNATL